MSVCCGLFIPAIEEHPMEPDKVVSHDEWIAARKAHLSEE